MLVALAIISVTVSVALPVVRGAPDRLPLEAVARGLQTRLQMARDAAVSSNDDQIVLIDTNEGRVTSTVPSGEQHLGKIQADLVIADVERRSASVGGIRFFSDGSSTGGTITLHLRGSIIHVSVDWLTGRARLDGRQVVS